MIIALHSYSTSKEDEMFFKSIHNMHYKIQGRAHPPHFVILKRQITTKIINSVHNNSFYYSLFIIFYILPRPYWRCYYSNTDAIIYVVDSADKDRIGISKDELLYMLRVCINYKYHNFFCKVDFKSIFSIQSCEEGGGVCNCIVSLV